MSHPQDLWPVQVGTGRTAQAARPAWWQGYPQQGALLTAPEGLIAAGHELIAPGHEWRPYPLALRSADVPPFGPGLAPARGPLGRIRDRVLRPLVLSTVEKIMLPPLNSVRAEMALPSLRHADELFRAPPLTLYLTAEPFEYPHSDWPDSVVMVGPCVWEPPADPPDWLSRIEEPIVLVTTSSEFQDDGRLVSAALQALAGEPVHVIAHPASR